MAKGTISLGTKSNLMGQIAWEYGGTWQRIEGRVLFGCASSGTVGATGSHTTGSGSSSLPYVNVAIWRRTA